jgi:hypothetical protein
MINHRHSSAKAAAEQYFSYRRPEYVVLRRSRIPGGWNAGIVKSANDLKRADFLHLFFVLSDGGIEVSFRYAEHLKLPHSGLDASRSWHHASDGFNYFVVAGHFLAIP